MPSAANYSKLRQHIVGCGVRRHKMFSSAATIDQTPVPTIVLPPAPEGLAEGSPDMGVTSFEPEASRRGPIAKVKEPIDLGGTP